MNRPQTITLAEMRSSGVRAVLKKYPTARTLDQLRTGTGRIRLGGRKVKNRKHPAMERMMKAFG